MKIWRTPKRRGSHPSVLIFAFFKMDLVLLSVSFSLLDSKRPSGPPLFGFTTKPDFSFGSPLFHNMICIASSGNCFVQTNFAHRYQVDPVAVIVNETKRKSQEPNTLSVTIFEKHTLFVLYIPGTKPSVDDCCLLSLCTLVIPVEVIVRMTRLLPPHNKTLLTDWYLLTCVKVRRGLVDCA